MILRTDCPCCFNPCCIGFSVATRCISYAVSIMDVSILVVLDLALQRTGLIITTYVSTGFNPCCIGFSVATLTNNTNNRPIGSCFNPCCIGFSVATTLCQAILISLDWRFNPCCIGFSVATKTNDFKGLKRDRFQSLLYWI